MSELKSLLYCKAGVVGMNMELDDIVVLNDNNAVADSFKVSPECIRAVAALVLADQMERGL